LIVDLHIDLRLRLRLRLRLLFDLGFFGVEFVRVVGRLGSSGTFGSRHFFGEKASLWVDKRGSRVEAVVVVEVEAEVEVSSRR
jgi:hypothetical protein